MSGDSEPAQGLVAWAGLEGRTAVVTGAAGGIGRGVALALVDVGMRVALCDRDPDGLAAVVAELTDRGSTPLAAASFDVREADAFGQFFARIDDVGYVPHVLVNVVGGTFHSTFLETRPRGWQALVELNFTSVLTACHLAGSRMADEGRGSIVNITTIEAHRGAPGYAVYAGLKSAVEGFGRSLAVELGPRGVRVNCVAPDYLLTPGTEHLEREQGRDPIGPEEARAIVPLGRLARPHDVAGSVVFLASDLSAMVTGQTLHPDGGALAAGRWSRYGDDWVPRLPSHLG